MNYILVSDNNKKALRQRYIDRFVDATKDYYKECIQTLVKNEDGLRYTGYLWDCLKGNESYQYVSSMDTVLTTLSTKRQVYVMWDIFSNYRVSNRWALSDRHPKDTVIHVDSGELCKIVQDEWDAGNRDGLYLPEDIYVFDESMQWTAVFTHEWWSNTTKPRLEDNEIVRICFFVS